VIVPDAPTIPDNLLEMLEMLAETIVAALGFGVAAINLSRPDGNLEVVAVAGDPGARAALLGNVDSAEVWDDMLAVSEHWGRLRFADHHTNSDFVETLRWVPDLAPVEHENAWHPEDALFAPLTAVDGTRIGVLSVDLPHDGLRPTPATCRALEAFAISAALAIEHATLRSRAEASESVYRQLAISDPLTGLGNRSMLANRTRQLPASDEPATTAIAFLDLDGFKEINDRFSHETGDLVLQTVAQRIRSSVRPHDTVLRWGGDEFLVLLEQVTDRRAAMDAVHRIAAAVSRPIEHEGATLVVTASVGVAFETHTGEIDADELVRRADAAMYQVKHAGRNAIAVFEVA
jgi:diguanylate cyclase (GGDEF)-like protein